METWTRRTITFADGGVGADTWRANKLDPTGGQATEALDPDGTSWLAPGQRRSPTGNLYQNPAEPPDPDNLSVWQLYGTFDVGYLHSGNEKYALYELNVSEVLMRQSDSLIPPTNCQGVIGIGAPPAGGTHLGTPNLGPQNPGLIPCSQWNTTAALSQQTANVNVRNTPAEAKLSPQPSV